MSLAGVNGREVGRKIDELLTGFAIAYAVSIVVDAVTELQIKPLAELVGDFILGLFD